MKRRDLLILLWHLAFSGVILCGESVAQLSKLAFHQLILMQIWRNRFTFF